MEGKSILQCSSYMLATSMFTISVLHIAVGQTPLLRLLGDTAELTCASNSEDDTYIWSDLDVTPALNIYLVSNANVQEKTGAARNIPKYHNFGIDNNYPGFVNLIIQSVEIEDEGPYQCTLVNMVADSVAYDVHVEALPTSVSVSCTTQPPDECSEPVGDSSDFTCTCTALGAYPDDLHFEWTNAVGDPTSTRVEPSSNRSGAYDYTGIATFRPTDTENTVTCSLGGYSGSWSVPDSNYTVGPPGKCDISIICNDEATVATLTCSCSNGVPKDTIYTYYDENGAVVTSEVSVTPDVHFTVGCRACNGVNYGEDTFISKNETCTVSTTAISTITERTSTKTNTNINGPTTEPITTAERIATKSDTNINDSPGRNTGLIAACSIVAVVFVAALAFVIIFLIRRYQIGLGKDRNKSIKKKVEAPSGGTDDNGDVKCYEIFRIILCFVAYMDLQDMGYNKNRETDALQIPERNVKLISGLPGNGLLQYHKALITRAKGNQEGVVRTLTDNSTLAVIKILRSEVQENLKLGNDNNIVQLLGWYDTVPTFAIFELVRGRNLSNHLKEEFSPHSVHTYGNTKKNSFQVSEKGDIDVLPKYALHVAKGIQFLTKNKFLHPGLRAKKVLLDTTGNCKIYDFVSLENAKEWTSVIWNESVPYQWMPPEFLFLEAISSAGDIWSFGVLLWEIFSYGSEPYIGQTRSDVERKIRQKELLRMPNNCPGAIWQLMLSCWQSSVEQRLPMDDITARLTSMCHQDKEYQEIN